jgi:2-alkyl-3-oxoalkanoate reductase
MRVFLAGATGSVGRRLLPRLIDGGHEVTATTTNADKAGVIRRAGATPVVLDGLDAAAIGEAVARAEPEAIIHNMTALAGKADMKHFDRWFARTNELRTKGTDHLLAAAHATGTRRFIIQSYTGWNNAHSGGLKTEDDPLDPEPAQAQRETMAAILYLERAVLGGAPEGIVLRYGNLYGPGSTEVLAALLRKRMMPIVGDGSGVWTWLHVDDAAAANVAALTRGRPGVYNIVDDEPAPVSKWLPALADAVGAPRPMRIPVWLGRLLAGDAIVRYMTDGRGASNGKAKRELGWRPAWSSWRDGFRQGLSDSAPRAMSRSASTGRAVKAV